MKNEVLALYERKADGTYIIDISAGNLDELYSHLDRSAIYTKRDLNQNLVEYLTDCAKDLGSLPYLIRLSIEKVPDDSGVARIQHSFNKYFSYLAEKERQKIRVMIHKSSILLTAGVAILFVSVWFNQWLGVERSVVANVFAQGLTIAAWISLWESLATLLLEWLPYRKEMVLYRRLAITPLEIR